MLLGFSSWLCGRGGFFGRTALVRTRSGGTERGGLLERSGKPLRDRTAGGDSSDPDGGWRQRW